jgi:predicted alpha/beta superfamily hydrolase
MVGRASGEIEMFRALPVVAFLATVLALAAPAMAQPVQIISPSTPATLSRSEQFTVWSKPTGREYRIQIAEPVRPVLPGEKVSVIYVLDGNYMFGMATDVSRNLQIVREMGPTYIVAIGYNAETLGGWIDGRLQDYIHVRGAVGDGPEVGGGGAAFQRFLVEGLRPLIEARYPQIDPAKSYLYGHSLGGQFAVNVMLSQPEAFAGYLVGSPSIWTEPSLIERLKARLATGGGRRVFLGVEGLGDDENARLHMRLGRELGAVLKGPGSTWVVEHRNYPTETHVSSEGVIFANGASFLIPSPPPPPPAATK